MTATTMWTRTLLTVGVVAAVVSVLPPEPVIVAARLVGLVVCLAIIGWYHRNADWISTRIGRGTMAVKAGILAIAVAANINSVNRHLVDRDLSAFASRSLAAAWLLLAGALIFRLVTMRRVQARGETIAAVEKEHP